jgi:hypothetical protein
LIHFLKNTSKISKALNIIGTTGYSLQDIERGTGSK